MSTIMERWNPARGRALCAWMALALTVSACAPMGPAPRPGPTARTVPPASPAPSSEAQRAPAPPGEPSLRRGQDEPPRIERSAPLPPPRPQSDAGGASQTLLSQSREQRATGNYAGAAATVERALRIDPNNPALWIELGEIELQTGNASQAETMARKALTLTGGDRQLAARAERLLRAAQ